jgi:hypothetical protein
MGTSLKKIVNLNAKLIINDTILSGIIENISRGSLYVIAVSTKPALDFTPGKSLMVKFKSPSDETICLHCRVTWYYETPPYGLTNSVGIEIISPFSNYEEILKSL